MSITDKISKHYQASIGGELKKIHVKEWDTDIYFRTTYSLRDEELVLKLQTEGKTVQALVESIIVKARTKGGERLFHDADRIRLMNEADPLVVIKVASEINNARLNFDQASIAKE
tara:strand:- start:29 stop:373 length:345 start_codon:yes stop_codon:yes gene_type:complete